MTFLFPIPIMLFDSYVYSFLRIKASDTRQKIALSHPCRASRKNFGYKDLDNCDGNVREYQVN